MLDNFSNFGTGNALKPEGIAVAPRSFGSLGGYVIVTLEGAGKVLAIPPDQPSKVTTIAQFPGEEPERVLQIPPSSDLYVAGWAQGAIYRVAAGNFSKYSGSLVVIAEGENEPFATVNVLQFANGNVTKTRILQYTDSPHFEGADFVPVAIGTTVSASGTTSTLQAPSSLPATTTTTGGSSPSGESTSGQTPSASEPTTTASVATGTPMPASMVTLLEGAVVVVVLLLLAFLLTRRRRS